MTATLDIAANRAARKYSRSENLQRLLWALARPLFRYSPRILFGWRNGLLRLLGARIGQGVRIEPTVSIFLPSLLEIGDWSALGDGVRVYNLGLTRIGARSTVSQAAHLCGGSHDDADPALPLIRAGLVIGDQAWICADAFVGPGVAVGDGAVVGARAVAMRDVPAWTVVAGNPARPLRPRRLRPPSSKR